MPDENTQPAPEPVSSEPSAPSEPVEQAPIPATESAPVEVLPVAPEAPPSPENAISVKDQNPANEPLNHTPEPEITTNQNNPNITIEKQGSDVTITEVMQSNSAEATLDKPTAQMAGNEPLSTTEAEKIKQRKENLEKANLTRQNKKREKIDEILDLFAKQTNLTNDEVEKLLHVSDATATRYLETLEKEGKIKQVGKTGKGVTYEKI